MNIAVRATDRAAEVMARAGKTFHLAARILSNPVRTDVTHLYAFCRKVDDLADQNDLDSTQRRSALESLAEALEEGDPVRLRAAGWSFCCDGAMPRSAALLVRAALGDLQQRQPGGDLDLQRYAFGVAGTVGLMMSELLRAQPEGREAAIALGMAMQLSNISRDVAEDYDNGRVYLPRHSVSVEEVGAAIAQTGGSAAQRTQTATLHVLDLAEGLYQVAYDGMWTLPLRIRWSILAAAMCYRQIGLEVRRDVEASWRRRTVVSLGRKAVLILHAAFRLLEPRFWKSARAATRRSALSAEIRSQLLLWGATL